MHNHTVMPNYHILKVKYISQTNTKPSKVKITSERFKQSISFSFNSEKGHTLRQGEAWLIENGHSVIGHGEGNGHYYVICDQINGKFKQLKEN